MVDCPTLSLDCAADTPWASTTVRKTRIRRISRSNTLLSMVHVPARERPQSIHRSGSMQTSRDTHICFQTPSLQGEKPLPFTRTRIDGTCTVSAHGRQCDAPFWG